MNKLSKCAIVIVDDYKNVLLVSRGKSKFGQDKMFELICKDLKGKEDGEKCINKGVDKDLKCTIFDLEKFSPYSIDEENELLVYTGKIREMPITHKTINEIKWINRNKVDEVIMSDLDKKILKDFFEKL